MEFNEVENLSEEQIAELYSDVVQGPEPVLLSASYTYSSEFLGYYYIYDEDYGYWICKRFMDYGCSTIGYNHFYEECHNPNNGANTINDYTAKCDYGSVK